MKREKTVVEKAADISDTKKQEMITMMMREQTSMAMKINKEQTRQEELVCHNLQTVFVKNSLMSNKPKELKNK